MAKSFNIADMYELVADAIPDREALVCGNFRATFSQLDERANKLAHFMAGKGIKAGDHVGLYMYNCGEFLEAMLACFKIRAVPINVNYRYVGDELLYIFANSDMVACVHGREFVPVIREILPKTPKLKTFIAVDDGFNEDISLIGSTDYEKAIASSKGGRDFGAR